MKEKRTKGGFTILECIAAIAVVLIITATALSVFTHTQNASDNQWNSYQTVQMANNILACFQGSDDFETFLGHLKELQKFGETQNSNYTIKTDNASYLEYTPEGDSEPVPFKALRASESGKIEILDGDNKVIATFNYGGKTSNYNADVQFIRNTAFFTATEKYGESTQDSFKLTMGYEADTTNNKYTTRNFEVTFTDTNTVYKSLKGTTKSYTTTAFEKYLLSQNYYLSPTQTSYTDAGQSNPNSSGYIQFAVYNTKTNQPVTQNGNPMQVVVRFTNSSISSLSSKNDNWDKDSPTVTSIEYRYYSTTSTAFTTMKDAKGNAFANFQWPAFLYISAFAGANSATKAPYYQCVVTSTSTQGALEATTFTLKSGGDDNIRYVLSGSNSVQFHNNNGVFYQYTAQSPVSNETFGSTVGFDSVYVYKNNVICFYNGSSPVLSFPYSTDSAYAHDVSASISDSHNFTAGGTHNTGALKVQVTAGPMVENWNNKGFSRRTVTYYVDAVSGQFRLYVYEDTESNTSRAKEFQSTASSLELDLARDGLILYYDMSSSDKSNNTLYFYAIDPITGVPKKNGSGQNMYIRLRYSSDSDTVGRWNVGPTNTNYMYFNVTSVDYTYSSAANISGLRSDSSCTYTAYDTAQSFTCGGGFIAYAYNVANSVQSTNQTFSFYEIAEHYNLSEYQVYTPESAFTANIGSVYDTPKERVFYNTQKTVVYANTEMGTGTAASGISTVKTIVASSLGMDTTEAYRGTTGLDKQYKGEGSAGISTISFDDTTCTIRFLNESGSAVITFQYTSSATYLADKREVVDPEGVFYQNFNGSAIAVSGTPIIRQGRTSNNIIIHQIVMINGTEETILFIAYVDSFKIRSNEIGADEFEKVDIDAQDEDCPSTTNYYTYSCGNYACIAKVTYSKYVADESVEPYIKVWLVSATEMNAWKNNCGDTVVDPTYEPFIYYRKG